MAHCRQTTDYCSHCKISCNGSTTMQLCACGWQELCQKGYSAALMTPEQKVARKAAKQALTPEQKAAYAAEKQKLKAAEHAEKEKKKADKANETPEQKAARKAEKAKLSGSEKAEKDKLKALKKEKEGKA